MNDFTDLTKKDAWECISPYIRIDENFDALSKPIIKRTFKHAVKKILCFKRNKGRSEDFVSKAYSSKWTLRDTVKSIADGGSVCVNWNTNKFVMDGAGLRKLHTLRIMSLIEKLKPKKVLDIGCGNGERILTLVCRFPNVEFTGLDLTEGGINATKSIQELAQLPNVLAEFSPQPLIDVTCHKNAKFICASAKNIPFEENNFDLVYTSLALEQMRLDVFKEIFRVTNKYVSFIS